jgi:hypothetical protein
MAVLLFLFTGFAIDGGLLYAQRRLMQNTADTACLAAANSLSLNKINAGSTLAQTAESEAQQVIQNNLGATPGTGVNAPGTLAYTNISEVYAANTGTGTGLTKGIEINGPDVRIALRSPANTFFMRVIGYNTYTVAARAHCDAAAGGGSMPFAVSRWRGYETSGKVNYDGLTTNDTLPQYYRQGATNKVLTVRDILAQEANSIICQPPATTAPSTYCQNWPGYGDPGYPGDPTTGTGLYSAPTSPATKSAPGPETIIAGKGAEPNVGDNTFNGPIVLDFRQTTFPSPLFYNGLEPTTALNKYKDFATQYILGTYPGPWVIPGQEIGYYNGISAGQIEKPFDQRFNKNDVIAVLIYNGTINSDPNFSVTFPAPSDSYASRTAGSFTSGSATCSVPSDEAFDGESSSQTSRKPDAPYKINLKPETYSTFKLRAFISSDDSNTDNWEGSWNGGSYKTFNINGTAPVLSISTSGLNIPFKIRPTNTFDCTDPVTSVTTTYPSRKDGAETIYLEAQDTATGKRRAVYVRLNQDADSNDFFAYFSQVPVVYEPIEQGNSTKAELKLDTVSGSSLDIGSGAGKVHVGTIEWYKASDVTTSIGSGTSLNGVTVDVSNTGSKNELTIDTSSTATTGEEYYIRIPLTYTDTATGKTYTHYAWYYFAVRTPLSNASGIGQFIYALGYASFQITDIGSNYIKGRAISGLARDPSELISGLQPRLLPWQ